MRNTLMDLSIFSILGLNTLEREDLSLWRAEKPIIQKGKYHSLILNKQEMKKAIKSSDGNYLFSETGAGVKPLVLIGKNSEIIGFLTEHLNDIIRNTIKELPNIYIGLSNYTPNKPYTTISPLADAMAKTISNIISISPFGGTAKDVGSIPGALKERKDSIKAFQKKNKETNILYLKISYLPEDGMKKVGSASIRLGDILNALGN